MALSVKAGSFQVGTTTGTLDITVGFQPSLVIFWGGKPTADDSATAHAGWCIGVMSGTNLGRSLVNESLDAQGTSAVGGVVPAITNDYYLINAGTTANPSINGAFTFSAWLASGFRINRGTAFDGDYRVNYLALGGTDLTNVAVGAFAMPTATGSGSVSGLGFQPDVVFLGQGVAAVSQLFRSSFGVATRGTGSAVAHQACTASTARDASNTMNGRNHGGDHACAVCQDTADSLHGYCDLSSFDSGGFSYSWTKNTTTAGAGFYIAIKGGSWKSGSKVTAPDASFDEVYTTGFQPKMVMGASIFAAAAHTTGTDAGPVRFSLGAASSTTQADQRALWAIDPELGTSDNATALADALLLHRDTATGFGLLDELSVIALGTTSFTTSWASAARTFWWWWVAAGDSVSETEATARVAGTATLEATATGRVAGTATLEKTETQRLAGTANLALEGAARLAGTATLETTGAGRLAGIATLDATSVARLAGVASLTVTGTARLAGTADLVLVGVEATSRLAGVATLEAAAAARLAGVATLETTVTVRLAGVASLAVTSTARLAGLATLEAAAAARLAGTATLDAMATARLAGTADPQHPMFEGTGRLAGLATLLAEGVARLAGTSLLERTSSARLAGTANPSREAEGAGRLAGIALLTAALRHAGRHLPRMFGISRRAFGTRTRKYPPPDRRGS